MIAKQEVRNKAKHNRNCMSPEIRCKKSKFICMNFAAELDCVAKEVRRQGSAKGCSERFGGAGVSGAGVNASASAGSADGEVAGAGASDAGVAAAGADGASADVIAGEMAPNPQLHLAAYEPMGSEVDVHPLLKHAYATGWHVFMPCMAKKTADSPAQMIFFEIPQERLSDNRPAFLDHPARPYLLADLIAEGWKPADASLFDAVVVPMVAYDSSNMRLGYGGGNYDRFLPQLRESCFIAGVAFEEQRIDAVPTEPHDLSLPRIFTA